mgnify:CR=1 FL=1
MSNLLTFVNKMNDHFKNLTGRAYPLASGNCGIFAHELSKKLTSFGIEHKVEIYTDDENIANFSDKEDVMKFIENVICCDHMVVKLNETIVDYNGYSTDAMLRDYMVRNWNCCESRIRNIGISAKNTWQMIDYIESVGCGAWLSSSTFEKYMDTHLVKEMCIL